MGETDSEMKKNIEALLFAAGRTVTKEEIESILGLSTPGLVQEIVKELKQEYDSRDSPILLIEEGEGWKLTVKESFLPVVQKINPHTEMSKAVMETLAIIAWKQPVLQAKVVDIRSNKAYDHIKELVELGFISKEKYGRSFLLKPTQKFLDYFDLPDQEAARKLFRDFKDEDLQRKVNQFKKGGSSGEGAEEPEEHLGELEVYDAGQEKDTYADRAALAAEGKKGKLGDLDVYSEGGAQGQAAQPEQPLEDSGEEGEEPAEEQEGSEDTSPEGEGAAPAEAEPPEESEEEKAKRLAQELLEEENSASDEKTESEEEIHSVDVPPELEDYVKNEEGEAPGEGSPPEAETPKEPEAPAPEAHAEEDQVETSDEDPDDEDSGEDDEYEKKRKALEEEEMRKEAASAEQPADAEGESSSDEDQE